MPNIHNYMFNSLVEKYNIADDDLKFIMNVINPIINHKEFIRRCTQEFLHHDKLTLGYHIMEDMFVSFLICKKKALPDYQIKIVLLIAMMHDLYEIPWQNAELNEKSFFHQHGFRHPVEAAINSVYWFPELFQEEKNAEILIDGIIHHMYPFPVIHLDYDNYQNLEIQNIQVFDKLDKPLKDIIIKSTNRGVIGQVSFSKTLYLEGKIVSKADKISSLDNFSGLSSVLALLTGKNKNLK